MHHTEYRIPCSFLSVPERFVSHGLTPAAWPRADALIPWRALFKPCELGRPPKTRVRPIQCARLGVNGFGYFCRNKSGSAAGPNPVNVHLVQSFDFVLQLNKIPYSPEDAEMVWPL